MEIWEAAQNWLLFGAVAGGLIWYYYPSTAAKAASRTKSPEHVVAVPSKKRVDRESRPRPKAAPEPSQLGHDSAQPSDSDVTRGRKGKKPAVQPQAAPKVVVQDDEAEEIDMSTRQFAQQMTQARKGHNLNAPKENEKRVKTVKQTNAKDTLIASSASSQGGADADDDLSPAPSPALRAGDVSDMLDPTPSGPKSLRLTGANEVKQKASKQTKVEAVETKKQRQNRQKVEERKLQREEEERQRKALEEKQRRAAREARGEPAKNGVPAAKPAQSAWSASQPQTQHQSSPLLDTFDATSTSSSVGGFTTSSTATSTSGVHGGEGRDDDHSNVTMAQSIDESGWTTVAVPKKQKKGKTGSEDGAGPESASIEAAAPTKSVASAPKPVKAVRGEKPSGFQVLGDTYQQRTDADPNDPNNWDA